MDYSFYTLDVFTSERFAGNPLAVVLEAGALTSADMRNIAREFNLSETVFVLPPANPAHTARIRIFTPGSELPFAGHPTVGTAILLAELRGGAVNGEQDSLVVLEEEIGPVRVGVRKRGDKPAFAEFDIPKLPIESAEPPSNDQMAGALGISPSEIGFENHRPTCFNAGLDYTYVPVRDLDVIARAEPIQPYFSQWLGAGSVYLYCRETVHTTSHFHARMFAPGHGIPEDPATGSAAAGFAGVVFRFDQPKGNAENIRIEQGYEMGRPSLIELELILGGGRLSRVRIGGHAILVTSGVITV